MKKQKGTNRSKNKYKWDLALTNDVHLTGHRKSRPVVVVSDDGVNVKVSRITSLDGKEDKIKRGYIQPIGRYKNLEKSSGVDKFKFSNDHKTGKKLDIEDSRVFRKVFREKLRRADRRKVERHLKK